MMVLARQLGKAKVHFTSSDRAVLAGLLHRLPVSVLHRLRFLVRPDLHERDGEPQFRPVGRAGERQLSGRGVPVELHEVLAAVTGQQSADLPETRIDEIRQRLAGAVASPHAVAATLLAWLGRLPIPAEAFWGEGVLVRQLLAGFSVADIATAAAAARTGPVAMGALNLIMFAGDDGTLSEAVIPTPRQLFPPGDDQQT